MRHEQSQWARGGHHKVVKRPWSVVHPMIFKIRNHFWLSQAAKVRTSNKRQQVKIVVESFNWNCAEDFWRNLSSKCGSLNPWVCTDKKRWHDKVTTRPRVHAHDKIDVHHNWKIENVVFPDKGETECWWHPHLTLLPQHGRSKHSRQKRKKLT